MIKRSSQLQHASSSVVFDLALERLALPRPLPAAVGKASCLHTCAPQGSRSDPPPVNNPRSTCSANRGFFSEQFPLHLHGVIFEHGCVKTLTITSLGSRSCSTPYSRSPVSMAMHKWRRNNHCRRGTITHKKKNAERAVTLFGRRNQLHQEYHSATCLMSVNIER